jgi:hypothetical protein
VNRRQFLAYSGIGLAMLGSGSMLQSLEEMDIVSREQVHRLDRLSSDLSELIYLAALAPSGHNTQPWTVTVVDETNWIIGTDKERWLPAVDPDNREMLLSIGAFLETLIIAAGVKGYKAEYEVLAKSTVDTDILKLKLYKTGEVSYDFGLEKIKRRRTLRSNLLNDELAKEDIGFITKNAADQVVYFDSKSRQGQYLAEGTLLANKTQIYRNSAQEELAKWIRWSNAEIKSHRNGLTPETMEITGIARWYVKTFFSRKSVVTDTFRETAVKKVEEQVSQGGGWLLVTSHGDSISELIQAGRQLQNIWLQVRDKMIAIHPMTQMLEENPWKTGITNFLGFDGSVQFILRVGYVAPYPAPVSLRMPLDQFVQVR